jgi:transcriptional regulator with XRE-family HTH domain
MAQPAGPHSDALARRLRLLRTRHWPDLKITQRQVADALGGLSEALISSWESGSATPPDQRLVAYATLFATRRSARDGRCRLIPDGELTDDEQRERERLVAELRGLRDGPAPVGTRPLRIPLAGPGDEIGGGVWHFPDMRPVTIVCARLPVRMRDQMPYVDPEDPDFVKSYTYADLDALIELFGHVRAVNPATQVAIRAPDEMEADDLTSHLVLLGGVDWNPVLRDALYRLDLPIKQASRRTGDQYDGVFTVTATDGSTQEFAPVLDRQGSRITLREDVAHFYRGDNPHNALRTLTICNGMFGRGTYGAVRALTDARFRDRNEEYLKKRFRGERAYSVITRVPVVIGETVTPDWTVDDNRLYEWPESGE